MLQLHVDYRLGGVPRYYMSEETDKMRIPDEIRKSVVFVCYKVNGGFNLAGTAFFVSVQPDGDFGVGFVYVVTAKHVIVEASQHSVDGCVYLRVNLVKGEAQLIEVPRDKWLDHPTDSSVDASILPWVLSKRQVDYLTIPDTMTATDEVIRRESIGIGDEVFLTGLFVNHYGQNRNLPIVRMGTIALMPEERIATRFFGEIEAYLVEARSIGGLSGSPVFVHLGGVREGTLNFPVKWHWLGLMHGHWDFPLDSSDTDLVTEDTPEKEAVNMGIAIVIPATQIMEIINQPMEKKSREEAINSYKEAKLPVEDGNSDSFSKEDFERTLRKVSRPQEDQPDEGSSET